jgi:hypothetical protein
MSYQYGAQHELPISLERSGSRIDDLDVVGNNIANAQTVGFKQMTCPGIFGPAET